MNNNNEKTKKETGPQESLKKRIKIGEISDKELAEIKAGVERAKLLSKLLDDAMLDPLGGIFAGNGDAATALAGLYIIYQADKIGLPYHKLAMMCGRQTLDFAAGSVPIIGDIFDFIYKSNKTNAEILRKHFEEIEKRKTKKELEKLKDKL